MEKQTVLFGGTIRCAGSPDRVVDAIAVQGDRIVQIGDGAELKSLFPRAHHVSLEGRYLVPGFIDSHCHVELYAHKIQNVNLMGTQSLQEALERIRARVLATPAGKLVIGRGWNKNDWPTHSFPTRLDLDSVSVDHPIVMFSKDGHAAWANSRALLQAGVSLMLVVGSAFAASAMQRHVSEQPAFVLYRPPTWIVRPQQTDDRLTIRVASPDGTSAVELEIADNRERRLDAVGVLADRFAQWRTRLPDLSVSAVEVCKAPRPSCAVATLQWRAGTVPMSARLFVHGGPELMTLRSYQAPSARLASERALLLDVLTNITVRRSRPLAPRMVMRRAADGSSSLTLPADWSFVAAKGAVLSSAPQGRAGFVFTSFQVLPSNYGVPPAPGVIISAYRGPEAFIHTIFQQFRNRNTRR